MKKERSTIRDFHGYHQHKEQQYCGNKMINRWVFYVCGFCFDDKHVHVLKSNGSEEMVPIDSKDRILINGKRYSRNFWNH